MESVESSFQGVLDIFKSRKVPVVSCGLLGLFPHVLHRIELRRIFREKVKLHKVFLAGQPLANFGRLVVRDVIRNQMDLDSGVVSNELSKEIDERIGVEPGDESEMPFRLLARSDGAHDLGTLAHGRA